MKTDDHISIKLTFAQCSMIDSIFNIAYHIKPKTYFLSSTYPTITTNLATLYIVRDVLHAAMTKNKDLMNRTAIKKFNMLYLKLSRVYEKAASERGVL